MNNGRPCLFEGEALELPVLGSKAICCSHRLISDWLRVFDKNNKNNLESLTMPFLHIPGLTLVPQRIRDAMAIEQDARICARRSGVRPDTGTLV